jgi:hypothetical protein
MDLITYQDEVPFLTSSSRKSRMEVCLSSLKTNYQSLHLRLVYIKVRKEFLNVVVVVNGVIEF